MRMRISYCSWCVFHVITLNVEAPFFLKKVEAFRTRLPMTYKENSFPNVNFKLIFKPDKASLGANQRILNVPEISLPHWRF